MRREYLYTAVLFTGLAAAAFAAGHRGTACLFGLIAVYESSKVYP